MWTMGDVLLSMYEELDACGLDKYGRPKDPVPTRETENANPVVVENKPGTAIDPVVEAAFVTEITACFPLLPTPKEYTPPPAARSARNYRRTPPGDLWVLRTQDRRAAPGALLPLTWRRTQHKMYHLAPPLRRIWDKTPVREPSQCPVWHRTQRKIPHRAISGCRTLDKSAQPDGTLYVCHICRRTPSLLLFPVCNSDNAYDPPIRHSSQLQSGGLQILSSHPPTEKDSMPLPTLSHLQLPNGHRAP